MCHIQVYLYLYLAAPSSNGFEQIQSIYWASASFRGLFHPRPLHCFLISNRTYSLSLFSLLPVFLLATAASLPHHCTITIKPVDQLFPCGLGLPASFESCCYTRTASTQIYTTAAIHQQTPTVLLTAWCVPLCATVNFIHTDMCLCTYISQHGIDN